MRHRVRSRKLGRTSAHRLALYRNMVTSLLEHERIQTTDAKAKEVRRIAERMITLGKRGTLHARRRALRIIRQREVAEKVFDELADRYRDRAGGYTRVLKLGIRTGDAAPVSIVELVEAGDVARPKAEPAEKKTARRKSEPKKAPAKKTPPKKKTSRSKTPDKKKPEKKKPEKKKPEKKKTSSGKTGTKKTSAVKTTAKKVAKKKTSRKKSD